jgi:hypothetical protein
MIRDAHGDLLSADADALVNTVNTVGVMGKGIALQFKKAYPANFKAYERACKAGTPSSSATCSSSTLVRSPDRGGSSTSRRRATGDPTPDSPMTLRTGSTASVRQSKSSRSRRSQSHPLGVATAGLTGPT